MATIDQSLALEQRRHMRLLKERLQEEFSRLAPATVIDRRQEIQDEIAVIDVQLAAFDLRLPPAPPPLPPAAQAAANKNI
jgi:hypothetical protein